MIEYTDVMSRTFTRERCIPWLCSQAGVRLEDEPQEIARAVDELHGRLRHRATLGLRFAGAVGLLAAALTMLTGSRRGRDETDLAHSSVRVLTTCALGGLGIAALLLGRRLERSAPALAILCAGRDADLDFAPLEDLVDDARSRMSASTCPKRQVWLISEVALSSDCKADAAALQVRCFAPVNGRITEV